MPPLVEFPRELFTEALAEHARLVDAHADAILTAPLEGEEGGRDVSGIDMTCSLLVSDGATHEIHKYRTQEVSYVVQRCHGIARRLMLDPEDGTTYVVVVARDVASLQLLRGVEPKRAGDSERLEVLERNLVVEPWDQWHWRTRRAVYTWWRTPIGELVASRAPWYAIPRKWPDVVDALVGLYEPELRRRLVRYERENPKRRGLAIVCTSDGGDDLRVVDRFEGDAWVEGFPATLKAAAHHRPGFDPVIVDGENVAGLRWLSRGEGRDLVVPEGMHEVLVDEEDEEEGDG